MSTARTPPAAPRHASPFIHPAPDLARIEAGRREILLGLGENPHREGLVETPSRVARSLVEPARALQAEGHGACYPSSDELLGAILASSQDAQSTPDQLPVGWRSAPTRRQDARKAGTWSPRRS